MKKTTHFVKGAAVILMIILAALVCGCPNGIPGFETFTATYDANGATSGSAPIDSATYIEGDTITVLDNTGALSKPTYSFTGWNTAADGSGTAYTAGSTFTMGASDITLYAVWSQNVHSLYFDANGGEGTMAAVNIDEGASATVPACGFTLEGSGFTGWNTKADGNGTDYSAGSSITMGSSDITLYAIWTKDVILTITTPSDNGYINKFSFTMDFTFNKDVTGFDAEDISVTNCTLSGFAGSGASYTATIFPSSEGDVDVTVAEAVAEDAYGYKNIETSCSLIYDKTAPAQIAGTNSAAGAGKLKITWIEPTTEEDSSFDHVVLKCYERGIYTAMSEIEVNKGTCEYTFEGLTTGKSYFVSVFPVDAAGNQQNSASSKTIDLMDDTFRNVYYITDSDGFTSLSDDLSGYYILMANISLSSTWTPVGTSADPFTGILESFWSEPKATISGLTTPSQDYSGLFGCAESAYVRNIIIKDAEIILSGSKDYNGVLVGSWDGGTIEGVEVSGSVGNIVSGSYHGGLAGFVTNADVTSCLSTAVVWGHGDVGGLVGATGGNSTISTCAVEKSSTSGATDTDLCGYYRVGGLVGNVESGSLTISECFTNIGIALTLYGTDNAAALCGRADGSCTVNNCYTRGFIEGTYTSCVGSFFGYSTETINCTNSYGQGKVSGYSLTGALYGSLRGSVTTTGCYYSTNTEQSAVKGDSNGTGTEVPDGSMSTITSAGGWDTDIWGVDSSHNDGYPYLLNNSYN